MKDNSKFRLDIWGIITLCTIAVYALFLIYPMAHLIQQSVIDAETGQFSMANFTKFFSKSYYFNTLFNSFKVSIAATVLSIAIGTPLAYIFSIYKIKGKSLLNILIIVASMSAPFIGAYSWILLLGRSGVITTFFKNIGITIPDIYGFGWYSSTPRARSKISTIPWWRRPTTWAVPALNAFSRLSFR